jgi:ABC-2 type transport system ATP-binding protein
VEQTCERVVIISEGSVVAEDTPDNLTARMRGVERILVEVEGQEQKLRDALKALPDISTIQIEKLNDKILKVTVESKLDLRKDIARTIVEKKMGLLEIHSDKVTLEDIFLDLTTKEEGA